MGSIAGNSTLFRGSVQSELWGHSLTQHLTNAAYCSQAEKEKKDKEDGYFTAPEMITFGDNYWQMHHNKLAKRAKQTDDQRLARREQIKELAKYVSKEFSASGTKLGVEEENYHTAAEYGSDEDDGKHILVQKIYNLLVC
jgi:hypothetical protein